VLIVTCVLGLDLGDGRDDSVNRVGISRRRSTGPLSIDELAKVAKKPVDLAFRLEFVELRLARYGRALPLFGELARGLLGL
jgi:hypothetical protein